VLFEIWQAAPAILLESWWYYSISLLFNVILNFWGKKKVTWCAKSG
jgi:hypothetical protein